MTDLLHELRGLRRPSLLIRAARHGQSDYVRTRDLRRLMDAEVTPTPTHAVRSLLSEEERIEATRVSDDPSYSVARHIDVLVALMAEAQYLRAESPQLKASGMEAFLRAT